MNDLVLGSIGVACLAVLAGSIAGAPTAFVLNRPRIGITLAVTAVVAFVGVLFVIAVAANPAPNPPAEANGLREVKL